MNTEAEKVAPAETPVAKIKTDLPRDKLVPLDWPVEFDGKTYAEIRIRRLTGQEVQDFIDLLQRCGGSNPQPPMIDCPLEVYRAMDDDDRYRVEEASVDFFPRRLRDMAESTLASAEESSPSSQAS